MVLVVVIGCCEVWKIVVVIICVKSIGSVLFVMVLFLWVVFWYMFIVIRMFWIIGIMRVCGCCVKR